MLHFLLKIQKLVGTGHSISMGQSKKILKGTIHFTKCFQNHTLILRARSAACDPHLRMLQVGLLTKLTWKGKDVSQVLNFKIQVPFTTSVNIPSHRQLVLVRNCLKEGIFLATSPVKNITVR